MARQVLSHLSFCPSPCCQDFTASPFGYLPLSADTEEVMLKGSCSRGVWLMEIFCSPSSDHYEFQIVSLLSLATLNIIFKFEDQSRHFAYKEAAWREGYQCRLHGHGIEMGPLLSLASKSSFSHLPCYCPWLTSHNSQ